MVAENPSILETRAYQLLPVFSDVELRRLHKFGTLRSYAPGSTLTTAGERNEGLLFILAGTAAVTVGGLSSDAEHLVTCGPGQFVGEIAQLSAGSSFVDTKALEHVSALVIPPQGVHALLIAEAQLGERILRAMILRRVGLMERGSGGPIIVGSTTDRDVLRLQGFLRRNGQPQQTLNPESDEGARRLIERFKVKESELPMVLCPNGRLLHNPNENDLARCLGVLGTTPDRIYDVAVVGAGPAGLSAAVYASSDGLSVLVIDSHAFGGQAGTSARIENYLGFPTGVSGMALMGRAYTQALKFGVDTLIPQTVRSIGTDAGKGSYALRLDDDSQVRARSVVIATGARYRRIDIENLGAFEGSSIHYWASPFEGRLCAGEEIAVVGGGNSAGQAVVYLSEGGAEKVWLLLRGKDLGARMSSYLAERIRSLSNVQVVPGATITALEGDNGLLQRVRWREDTGPELARPIRHVFLFIGADPNTGWLRDCGIARDAGGFVIASFGESDRSPLETSRPGIFAIGDVRCGSVKRVAAAVGEGAQVVPSLHRYLSHTAAPGPTRVSPPVEPEIPRA